MLSEPGLQATRRVSILLLKPEKVNMLVFLWGKNMQVLSLTGSLVLLFFLFFILKSFLSLPFTSRYAVEAFFKSFFLFDSSVFASIL